MDILVGYTGFVGGNIAAAHSFDMLCHSKNIAEAFGTNPDLLVYAGVPAEMFLANNNPDADRAVTNNAADTIRKINPKRLVLISTIAVLDHPVQVDEEVAVQPERLTPYGLHRFELEQAVCNIVPHCHIIRLPALFGEGIKKNFIYDMVHFFPAMLNKEKFDELSSKDSVIQESYVLQDNGFYKLAVSEKEKPPLKAALNRLGFSALNFTDSRSTFQYYNLSYLWRHIQTMMAQDIPLLHAATEPLSAGDVHAYIFGKPFVNELAKPPFFYDFRTKYAALFGGKDGYLFHAKQVQAEIKWFVEENIS